MNTTLQKMKFSLLNAFLSTFGFVLAYKLWLSALPLSIQTFALIFATMALISWAGALVSRIVTHWWSGREKNTMFLYRNFFITLFYSVLVFTGFISRQFEMYPIFPVFTSLEDFIYTDNVLFRLFLIKLFTMFLGDYVARYYLERRSS